MSSSNDDLKGHAASNQDFYALLDISPAAAEPEIRRAYRRTALKYHPDKISNPTPADIDKFHLLQIAYDVLSDPSVRQLYDNAREARERKQRERDMMGAAKRKMREDLEARERAGVAGMGDQRGVKRAWTGADVDGGDAEERLQREIERIAEDGRRRRREAEDRLKKVIDEEEKIMQQEEEDARRAADKSSQRVDRSQEGGTNVSELERGIKVRWVREGRGLELDRDILASLFAPFGKIESIITLKDKRQRIGEKKKAVATGVVIFTSIVSAHAAVLDTEKKRRQSADQTDSVWATIDSVFWASGTQPDIGVGTGAAETHPASAPPPPPQPNPEKTSSTPPPSTKPSFNFPGVKTAMSDEAGKKPGKAPSFASFSSAAAAANTPKPSSTTEEPAKSSSAPSMEEVTLMRLKNAQREKERKAMEEQLQKEDEAEDAAEAAVAGGS